MHRSINILLNNNGCGEIFYGNKQQDQKTVGRHIAADHNTSAKGWVETLGFKYLSSKTKEEFDENLKIFFDESLNVPIFFEVFTDKYANINEAERFVQANRVVDLKSTVKNAVKRLIGG